MTKHDMMIAISTFVTTADELEKEGTPFPASMLYIALGSQTEHLRLIEWMVTQDIAVYGPSHTLQLGERGRKILETIRKAQNEGKLPQNF